MNDLGAPIPLWWSKTILAVIPTIDRLRQIGHWNSVPLAGAVSVGFPDVFRAELSAVYVPATDSTGGTSRDVPFRHDLRAVSHD